MDQKILDVVRLVEAQERERLLKNPPAPQPAPERPTIHWTELKKAEPGSRIATEWNFYLTQVGRLLAEGQEGKWVLVKGERIIGIYDTRQEASMVAAQKFFREDVIIHQVLTREPMLRGPTFMQLGLKAPLRLHHFR